MAGPPGTGKTNYLTQQIGRAREVHGDDGVLVVSFTRAAAAEIAGRIGYRPPRRKDPPAELGQQQLPGARADQGADRRVGTLHSILYHRLGEPTIAESKLDEWNAANSNRPDLRLSEGGESHDDFMDHGTSRGTGDQVFQAIQRLRARQVMPELWPARERQFYRAWRAWKGETGYLDFTDLVEVGVKDGVAPPQGTRVCVVDEAQDFTRLELSLLRGWAEHMDRAIFAFDDDQSIYGFKGAYPEALIDVVVPPENRRVLSQSFRVPAAVHRLAEAWIRKVSRREEKEYRPRPSEGEVALSQATARHPVALVEAVEADAAAGRTVMVLASCSYMLATVIKHLREARVPFHNPFRLKRGDWNPLKYGAGSTGSRVWLFAQRNPKLAGEGAQIHVWTARDIALWSEHLSASVFRERGAKQRLRELADDEKHGAEVTLERPFFSDEAMEWIDRGDLGAFSAALIGSKRNSYAYAVGVAEKHLAALREQPRVVVGTVHSVKGGEADSVYVLPDLSPEAARRWFGTGKPHDEVRRVFYVAFTRAKDKLTLCGPSSRACVRWER